VACGEREFSALLPWYIPWLTDEYTNIYRHADEYTWLCLSVETIFLGSGTKEYITVIFFSIEEYKSSEECIMFLVEGDCAVAQGNNTVACTFGQESNLGQTK
jgi:hypothetical protein